MNQASPIDRGVIGPIAGDSLRRCRELGYQVTPMWWSAGRPRDTVHGFAAMAALLHAVARRDANHACRHFSPLPMYALASTASDISNLRFSTCRTEPAPEGTPALWASAGGAGTFAGVPWAAAGNVCGGSGERLNVRVRLHKIVQRATERGGNRCEGLTRPDGVVVTTTRGNAWIARFTRGMKMEHGTHRIPVCCRPSAAAARRRGKGCVPDQAARRQPWPL